MTEQDHGSSSSPSSASEELSNGGKSACSSSNESAEMTVLISMTSSPGSGAEVKGVVSHSKDFPDLHATTFPFLKLPLELRMRVYYYFFSLEPKWYFDTFRLCTRCLECDNADPPNGMGIECDCQHDETFPVPGSANEHILSLLQTCRQVHQEARYEIFKWNTFYFDYIKEDNLLVTPMPVPAVQVSFIRNVSVRLNAFGSLHWVGVMYDDKQRYFSLIDGLLRLRLGQQRSAKSVRGKPADEGLSGNKLKFLYWNSRISWHKLPQEWMKT